MRTFLLLFILCLSTPTFNFQSPPFPQFFLTPKDLLAKLQYYLIEGKWEIHNTNDVILFLSFSLIIALKKIANSKFFRSNGWQNDC